METMIHGRYINQGEDLTEVTRMRERIFGKGADESDPSAVNVLVSLKETAEDPGVQIGCGRLKLDLEAFRFEVDYLGILEPYRNKGYGEFALRTLADKVNQCGADRVCISEQNLHSEEAKRFFEKMFFHPGEDGFLCAEIASFHTCCHD